MNYNNELGRVTSRDFTSRIDPSREKIRSWYIID